MESIKSRLNNISLSYVTNNFTGLGKVLYVIVQSVTILVLCLVKEPLYENVFLYISQAYRYQPGQIIDFLFERSSIHYTMSYANICRSDWLHFYVFSMTWIRIRSYSFFNSHCATSELH